MVVVAVAVARSGTMDYTLQLVRKAGYIRYVLALDGEGGEKFEGVSIVKVGVRNNLVAPFILVGVVRRLSCNIVLLQYEYSMLGNPFLSHALLLFTLLLFRVCGIRVVVTLHGVLTPKNLSSTLLTRIFIRTSLQFFYNTLMSVVDEVVVLNEFQRKILEGYAPGHRSKISIIPHGALPPEDLGVTIPLRERGFTVFFHGFLRPSKGVHLLMDALKKLQSRGHEVKMKIMVSLPYMYAERKDEREYLEKILSIAKSVDNVHLLVGSFNDREIILEALSSDVIVLPYLDKYYESSGVLHKLMGCGKPIVVTPVPRFIADLKPWSECFVALPDSSSISAAIERLMIEKSLASRLAVNVIKKAKSRLWTLVAKEYAILLLKLISNHSNSHHNS